MSKRSEKVCCRLEHEFNVRLEEAACATQRSKSELMRDALKREVSRSLDADAAANQNESDGEIDA